MELEKYLQKIAGYILSGDVSYQKLFFFYGRGRNGKSVFVETLLHLLGEYAGLVQTETLMERDSDSSMFDVAQLAGLRVIVGSEIAEGRRWNEALLKSLTGDGVIKARRLYREGFSFRSRGKLIIVGNHKPAIRGNDDGIRERFVLIPFRNNFKNDPELGLNEKLKGEINGILKWAITGWKMLQSEGWGKLPDSIRRETDGYFAENDIIGQFLEDQNYKTRPEVSVSNAAIYGQYVDYCKQYGFFAMSNKSFSQRLDDRGFKREKTREGAIWRGIGKK